MDHDVAIYPFMTSLLVGIPFFVNVLFSVSLFELCTLSSWGRHFKLARLWYIQDPLSASVVLNFKFTVFVILSAWLAAGFNC